VTDFVIVSASIIECIISEASHGDGVEGLSALRLIRVMRVIRLVGMVERLATLVEAFVEAIKQVMWVGALMLSECLPSRVAPCALTDVVCGSPALHLCSPGAGTLCPQR